MIQKFFMNTHNERPCERALGRFSKIAKPMFRFLTAARLLAGLLCCCSLLLLFLGRLGMVPMPIDDSAPARRFVIRLFLRILAPDK